MNDPVLSGNVTLETNTNGAVFSLIVKNEQGEEVARVLFHHHEVRQLIGGMEDCLVTLEPFSMEVTS